VHRIGRARSGRRGHRAFVRRGGDRRPGKPSGRRAGRRHRRPGALDLRALHAASRALRHLLRDGDGPCAQAARALQPRRAAQNMRRDRTPEVIGVIFLVVALSGPWLPQWAMFILTIAFARGLVALGLMLLLRAGLVSFGQALYYCLGAYAAGALGKFIGVGDIFVQMLAGAAVAALVACVLGFLLARYRGIFFGLLSLALSMILYGLLVKNEALGSTDGFNILPSTLFGIRPAADWVRYCVVVAAAFAGLAAALLVHRYLNTPLGRLAPAIKDNEIRVEYMGASARSAIHVKYVIAAVLAGVG